MHPLNVAAETQEQFLVSLRKYSEGGCVKLAALSISAHSASVSYRQINDKGTGWAA